MKIPSTLNRKNNNTAQDSKSVKTPDGIASSGNPTSVQSGNTNNANIPEDASYGAIFWTFFKIGLFTFGGGYAMIPLIEREIIDRRGWIAKENFLELLTIAQSAPGPIALNTSVFVGYKTRGFKGATAAILGAITPSFFIILAVALFFTARTTIRRSRVQRHETRRRGADRCSDIQPGKRSRVVAHPDRRGCRFRSLAFQHLANLYDYPRSRRRTDLFVHP